MKSILMILTVLFASTSINSRLENTDLPLIEKTLNNYMYGLVDGDAGMIKKAFHQDATMKMIGKSGYESYNAIQALTEGLEPSPKETTNVRIVSVNLNGNAASAELEIQLAELTYTDFMQLLKIDGEWKIVSKIFYTKFHNP